MRQRKRSKSVRGNKTTKSKRRQASGKNRPGKDASSNVLLQSRYCSGEKAILLGVVAFDMFAVGLIVPLLTPFLRKLGASASQIGFLSSVYGSVQMFSAPLLGWISDRVSRRDVLFICISWRLLQFVALSIITNSPQGVIVGVVQTKLFLRRVV